MTSLPQLELQAIQAAKTQNWQTAIDVNSQIITENPSDINAFIRLGVAYAQIQENKKAEKSFKDALELDKSNQLAKKHLGKLKNNQSIFLSSLPSDEEFIEEPGKTKTVELHRLASKEQLEQIAVGQVCQLKPKNRFISVEVGKTYVGALPEDLSARLSKLIKGGNQYVCYIQSVSPTSCSVFIKETHRAEEFLYTNSFSVAKNQLATLNDEFLLADENMPIQIDDDVPIQIVVTENDEEKTMVDSLPMDDHLEELPDDVDE